MLKYLKGFAAGSLITLIFTLALEAHLGKHVALLVMDSNCNVASEANIDELASNYKHRRN